MFIFKITSVYKHCTFEYHPWCINYFIFSDSWIPGRQKPIFEAHFFFFKAEQLDVQLYFMNKRAPGVLFECRPWMLVQSAFKDCTISTVPITCSSPLGVWLGVVTVCNLEISPADQAKGYEIMSAFLISTSCCPYANMLVIPPMAGLRLGFCFHKTLFLYSFFKTFFFCSSLLCCRKTLGREVI